MSQVLKESLLFLLIKRGEKILDYQFALYQAKLTH